MSRSCDGTYEVYRELIRKARKQHKCSACSLPIHPGEYYAAVTWVFEGEAEGVKRCGACQTTHLHLRELCAAKYDPLWPDERLGCGLKYEEEWGDLPDEIAALPLLSAAERGALLKPVTKETT